jgi:broad specificity phosphatase PhoE
MNYQIVSKFFNTNVVIVAHGHVMEGLLTYQPGIPGVVGLTPIPNYLTTIDGYVLADTALVEVASIDIIRPTTTVVSQ